MQLHVHPNSGNQFHGQFPSLVETAIRDSFHIIALTLRVDICMARKRHYSAQGTENRHSKGRYCGYLNCQNPGGMIAVKQRIPIA